MPAILLIAAMVLFTIASLTGCRREEPTPTPIKNTATSDQSRQLKNWEALNREFARADELTARGKIDEATTLLQSAMARQAYRDWQPDIFSRVLRTMIATGHVAEAQAAYLVQAQKNPPLAARCFGTIEQSMLSRQQFPELLTWCNTLQNIPQLPEEMLTPLADIKIQALKATGQSGAELLVLRQMAPRFGPARIQGLATRIGTTMTHSNDEPQFKELLVFLDEQSVKRTYLRATRANLQLQWLTTHAMWDEAIAYYHTLEGQVPPDDLASLYSNLLGGLAGAARYEALDRESLAVVKNERATAGLRDIAARWYMTSCVQQGQIMPALERIKELRTLGFSAEFAAQWLDRLYPTLMRQETPGPEFKPIIEYAESLLADARETWARSTLAGIILDMTFRVEMFDVALRILEQGVPDQKPEWHAMMINKVKAHIALKANKYEDAYQRFVNFMKDSAMRMEEMPDPMTGERITRDMVMALNEKRLGDILVKMNRGADAAAAYGRARDYYTKALKATEPDSAQHKRLTAESGTIPPAG